MPDENLFGQPRVVLAMLHCAVDAAGGRLLIRPTESQLAFMAAEPDPYVGVLRYTITEEGVLLETTNLDPSVKGRG